MQTKSETGCIPKNCYIKTRLSRNNKQQKRIKQTDLNTVQLTNMRHDGEDLTMSERQPGD